MLARVVALLLVSSPAAARWSSAADELALLQVAPADARPSGKRHGKHHGKRHGKQTLSTVAKLEPVLPIYWVHVPKCGSSFVNTLIHLPGVCDETIPAGYVVDSRLGTNFLHQFRQKFDLDHACPGLMTTRFSHNGIDREVGYASAANHLMIMLRQPEQRTISAYNDMKKYQFTGLDGVGRSWGGWEGPLPTLPEYARKSAGCAVRMLTRGGLPCGAAAGPPSAAEEELAAKRLREGFVFVGITDRWALSMCLFNAMFGTGCHSWQFSSSRPSNKPGSVERGYDISTLQGVKDPYDGKLYAVAEGIFEKNLDRYNVNEASCAPCWRAAGLASEFVGTATFFEDSEEDALLE